MIVGLLSRGFLRSIARTFPVFSGKIPIYVFPYVALNFKGCTTDSTRAERAADTCDRCDTCDPTRTRLFTTPGLRHKLSTRRVATRYAKTKLGAFVP